MKILTLKTIINKNKNLFNIIVKIQNVCMFYCIVLIEILINKDINGFIVYLLFIIKNNYIMYSEYNK